MRQIENPVNIECNKRICQLRSNGIKLTFSSPFFSLLSPATTFHITSFIFLYLPFKIETIHGSEHWLSVGLCIMHGADYKTPLYQLTHVLYFIRIVMSFRPTFWIESNVEMVRTCCQQFTFHWKSFSTQESVYNAIITVVGGKCFPTDSYCYWKHAI